MRSALSLLMGVIVASTLAAGAEYSWQKPHAKVLPNGDLEWAPEPFVFETGDSVRYIDYEAGDDTNDGLSRRTPWKHHPWDRDAIGNAASASGPVTYVFKRGVVYRGQLYADESGKEGNPIRLTSDPDWGNGEAWFMGSVRLPRKWVPASAVDHPDRLPEPEKVWALDLKAAGLLEGDNTLAYSGPNPNGRGAGRLSPTFTALYVVNDEGAASRQHLARWPDWQRGSDNFAIDYWNVVDGPGTVSGEGGRWTATGMYDEDLKGHPRDYFTGGFIWKQYRSFMGTPTPSEIPAAREVRNESGETVEVPLYHPAEGVLLKGGQGGYGAGGLRYMIDNLPQFLDSAGEFYLDGGTGLLFYRPPGGVDPNDLHLELTNRVTQIKIPSQSHIEISGLKFSFAHGATIDMDDSTTDVNIHHCAFHEVPDTGVAGGVSRSDEVLHVMDRIRVADCDFRNVLTTAIRLSGTWKWNEAKHRGMLKHVEIMRNRTFNTGMRHTGSRWSNVPAIAVTMLQTGQIAGNVVRRSFGSGIVVLGGKEGNLGHHEARDLNLPLIRILVHHNKTEDTALGVNDYGGLALWQGGPIYCYSNNIGNSPGHMPSGFFNRTSPVNLSYPLYLDGAFKQYCFNNIIWGRTTDPDDPFANTTPGYFMVFGFLNQFTNNTIYRNAVGVGGSSGNRNDIVSNVFAEISRQFLRNNREGDPSLVGGGDDASSGIRGIPSLAFARNFFHGTAEAGSLLRERDERERFIEAAQIDRLAELMRQYPIRVADLGERVEQKPIQGKPGEGPLDELTPEVDFHPTPGSPLVDAGATYFVPWSLCGTVGEWHFNENQARPQMVTDYHWYMSEAHFHRSMYEYIPSFDLRVNGAALGDYVESASEDWVRGALQFDGKRFASYPDALLRKDVVISIGSWDRSGRRTGQVPGEPWVVEEPSGQKEGGRNTPYAEDDYMRYPAERRKTLIITTQNLLVEANLKVAAGTSGTVLGKHDGETGYSLAVTDDGRAEFRISSGSLHSTVATDGAINDGRWHHVLAEVDRQSGRMNIYLDGEAAGQAETALPADASLDNRADFIVGKESDDTGYLRGAIDFVRVCRGTLEDSMTSIDELYTWQVRGPVKRDFLGREPRGRRDAGALEQTNSSGD
ncbi:MAG: LamG domain-containing protein [Candidatus Brocadiia bacterium]